MSFDTEKKDQHERILCYHAESDSYFELFSQAEFDLYCAREPFDNVTGIEHHEAEWKKLQHNQEA